MGRRGSINRRGISTVIGIALFVILILAFLNVFHAVSIRYDSYQQVVNQMDQWDREAINERLSMSNVSLTSANKLNLTVQNSGGVAARLVSLWVIDESTNTLFGNSPHDLDTYVTQGATVKNIGTDVDQLSLDPEGRYFIKLVTERGNIISGRYPEVEPVTMSELQSLLQKRYNQTGLLSIGFDYETFKFTSKTVDTPTPAWTISKDDAKDVIWWIKFVNHGTEDITILKWSYLELIRLEAGSITSIPFWVVHPDSQVGSLIAYDPNNPIVIPCSTTGDYQTGGTPTTIKFGSSKLSPQADKQSFSASVNYQYNLYIIVYYMYKGQQFGQVIPYAAIVITS